MKAYDYFQPTLTRIIILTALVVAVTGGLWWPALA